MYNRPLIPAIAENSRGVMRHHRILKIRHLLNLRVPYFLPVAGKRSQIAILFGSNHEEMVLTPINGEIDVQRINISLWR